MTITRETLELAAKAAGYEVKVVQERGYKMPVGVWQGRADRIYWNPVVCDGDSARLRTDCSLDVEYYETRVAVLERLEHSSHGYFQDYKDHNDKHAALRYATLMVAAEIGRRMP